MKIVLVKQTDAQLLPDTPDALAMRKFLFEMLDGATDKDTKAWRSFIGAMNKASAGDYFQIEIKRQRNEKLHKLMFAVMNAVFKSQESCTNSDLFRKYVLMGAGFVDYIPDEKTGELKSIPRSQNYDECSEEEARELFPNMCAFLRSATCCATLWPNTPIANSMKGMEDILRRFDYE